MKVNTTIDYIKVESEGASDFVQRITNALRAKGAPDGRITQYFNILNRYDGNAKVFSVEDVGAKSAMYKFPSDYCTTEMEVYPSERLLEKNYDWEAWLSYAVARMEVMITASKIAKMQPGGPKTSFKTVGDETNGVENVAARDLRSLIFKLLIGGAPVDRVIEVLELANYDEHTEHLSWKEVELISECVHPQVISDYILSESHAVSHTTRYTEENFDWERLISDVEARLDADAFM